MFKVFNKNILIQSILLVLMIGYSLFIIISKMEYDSGEKMPFLASWLQQLSVINPGLFKGLVIFVLFLKLILLQVFYKRNNFSDTLMLWPSLFYLSLLLVSGSLYALPVIFFVNLFVLILLLLNMNYELQDIKNQTFLSGLIVGIVIFFDFSTILLLLFIIASLIINRFSKTKEIAIAILGFIIPWIYVLAYYLFSDQIFTLFSNELPLSFFGFYNFWPEMSGLHVICFTLFILGLIYIAAFLKMLFSNKLILDRRRLLSVNLLTYSLFITLFLTGISYPSLLCYLFVPVSLYFSILTQFKKNWIFNDILMLFLIILMLWL